MRTFTKFSLRFGVYLLVLLYIVGDLFLFEGPINKKLTASDPNSPEAIAKAKANGVIARVFNHQITRTQLDYAMHQRLWLSGKSISEISPQQKKHLIYATLGDLIDHELIRVKVKVNTAELPVSDEEIEKRLKRFASKFESRSALESAMKLQGIPTERSLRNRIAARIQQEKYIALRVDPLVSVSEQEIQDFIETNEEALIIPERIRAQHIFIPTLEIPSAEAKQRLETALAQLEKGEKTFSALAKEISEDPATKNKNGDLGWMSKQRLPADFSEPVFALKDNHLALVQTKIGWHLIRVTERKPSRPRTPGEAKKEITRALSITKRHQAVKDFKKALRQFEAHKIDIFHDQLIAN